MILLKNFGAYLVTNNRVSLKLSQVFAKDTRTTPIPKFFDFPGFEEWNNYFSGGEISTSQIETLVNFVLSSMIRNSK